MKKQKNEIEIPLSVGLRGEYEIEVVDTNSGIIKHKRKEKNMIVDNAFSQILGENVGMFSSTNYLGLFRDPAGASSHRVACYVGSGGNPNDASMVTLQSRITQRGPVSSGSFQSFSEAPYYTQRRFIFPAGSLNHTVREIGLGRNWANSDYLWTRVVLSPEIEVIPTDELRVTWRIYYDLPINNTWEGVMVGGQRDGITDVNWKLFISNAQTTNFFTSHLANGSALPGMFATGNSRPVVRLGTSNEDSNLESEWSIKGSSLFSGGTNNSFKSSEYSGEYPFSRTLEIGFEHNSPNNVQIGEMVVFRGDNGHQGESLFRITFNPVLDKAEFFRLFIKYRLTLTRS